MAVKGKLSGYEGEISTELRAETQSIVGSGAFPTGIGTSIMVPFSALGARQLEAGTSGGNVVGENLLEMSGIANHSAVARLAVTLPNLKENLSIHHTSEFASVQWTAESGALIESSPEFKVNGMKPYRIGGMIRMSRQLSVQTGADYIVGRDLSRALAMGLDSACIFGDGNLKPLGILNDPKSILLPLTNAPIFDYICEARRTILETDIEENAFAVLISPLTEETFNTSPIQPNTDRMVSQAMKDLDWRLEVSPQMASGHRIICGLWAGNLVIGIWGNGVSLTVDPFSLAHVGFIRIVGDLFCDCAVRHATFTYSEPDAANPAPLQRNPFGRPAIRNSLPARPAPAAIARDELGPGEGPAPAQGSGGGGGGGSTKKGPR